MKKEVKKIIINFSDIQKKCDSDYQKLSDKCKNYELSHNRKSHLLEKIKKQLQQITDEIEVEINAPLRVRVKSEPKDIFYWKGVRDAGIIPTTDNNTFCSLFKQQNTEGKKENV